jgi:hypothetical protein
MGARTLRASASSLSDPVLRAISTLERDSQDRVFIIPELERDDAALPHPAQPVLGGRFLAGESPDRVPAQRDGGGVDPAVEWARDDARQQRAGVLLGQPFEAELA